MPQGSSAAPGWFVEVINEVIKGLDRVAAYLDNVIVFDAETSLHVVNMRKFVLRLRKCNLKLSPSKDTIGATKVDFLGHTIFPVGSMPNAKKVEALKKLPYRKMAKRIRPTTSLLKQGVKFVFIPAVETIVRELLAELSTPPVLVFPNWDDVTNNSRPFLL